MLYHSTFSQVAARSIGLVLQSMSQARSCRAANSLIRSCGAIWDRREWRLVKAEKWGSESEKNVQILLYEPSFLMPNRTPFLPGISAKLYGRRARSEQDRLRDEIQKLRRNSLTRLCELFGPWLPLELFELSINDETSS